MDANDELNITELELLKDGRVFVFGASREILSIMNEIQCSSDNRLGSRLNNKPTISSGIEHQTEGEEIVNNGE